MPVLLEEKSPQNQMEVATTDLDIVQVRRQRRQMLVALGILVVAIVLLVIKDWQVVQSWFFSPASPSQSEPLEHSVAAVTNSVAQPSPATAKSQETAKHKNAATKSAETAEQTPAPVVTSDRAALPPLEVEVVAGGRRSTVQPASNSVKVDLQSENPPAPAEAGTVKQSPAPGAGGEVVNATESVHLSQDTLQVVSRPVQPNYPLLAKQMKVQGSVVLQALIGKSGSIEDLRVLSGPAILSSAAMEAVKQWRFRPYYVSGAMVETQARITVNFTISTY